MNRRGFLGSILALGAAPAIVRADSLMRIVPLETGVLPMPSLRAVGDAELARPCLNVNEVAAYVREIQATLIGLGIWPEGYKQDCIYAPLVPR